MIVLYAYMTEGMVTWSMFKPRPSREWTSLGTRYWERRGEVRLDEPVTSDRELLSAALRAILDRLGER